MKGALVTTAVVGALAIGGLPALALTLAADETRPGPSLARRVERPGPPPWSQGHGRDTHGDKHADKVKGWAKERTDKPGRQHGSAMRDWAHCVADAAAALPDGRTLDPVAACGSKPTPPGHQR